MRHKYSENNKPKKNDAYLLYCYDEYGGYYIVDYFKDGEFLGNHEVCYWWDLSEVASLGR